jgi:hypothetical protein
VTCARLAVAGAALAGCGELSGFGGAAPPLATIQIAVTGDLAAVQVPGDPPPRLRAAVVWAAQWLTEPLCILPPDDARAVAVITAGCRDPFGMVPDRVATNAPLAADGTATLELLALPAADVMVGDVTARVAYANLVVYDDRDGDATFTLSRPNRLAGRELGPPETTAPIADLVYAASFVTMTAPDTRLAFREGAFVASAFFPRAGCGDPPPGFSLISAGGFSYADAIAAQLRGELPRQPAGSCRETTTEVPVTLRYRAPAELRQVACEEVRTDSSIRYREPPTDAPDFARRTSACVKVPDFGTGRAGGAVQLVVSGRSDDSCVGLTHYVLRGCRNDPLCVLPQWDITESPPGWWPCPPTLRTR